MLGKKFYSLFERLVVGTEACVTLHREGVALARQHNQDCIGDMDMLERRLESVLAEVKAKIEMFEMTLNLSSLDSVTQTVAEVTAKR